MLTVPPPDLPVVGEEKMAVYSSVNRTPRQMKCGAARSVVNRDSSLQPPLASTSHGRLLGTMLGRRTSPPAYSTNQNARDRPQRRRQLLPGLAPAARELLHLTGSQGTALPLD